VDLQATVGMIIGGAAALVLYFGVPWAVGRAVRYRAWRRACEAEARKGGA